MAAITPKTHTEWEVMTITVDTSPIRAALEEAAAGVRAAQDVLAERRRQIEAEGWTPDHDDDHDDGEMILAAIAYAMMAETHHPDWTAREREARMASVIATFWPWDRASLNPKDARRDLVRAAALLIAEIERIDRAAAKQAEGTR